MTWREIRRYKICDGDGNPEELILERNEEGVFRLKNDFGNMSFEFDQMTGAEFIRKMFDDMKTEIENDINDWWKTTVDEDSSTQDDDMDIPFLRGNNTYGGDCDGQPD